MYFHLTMDWQSDCDNHVNHSILHQTLSLLKSHCSNSRLCVQVLFFLFLAYFGILNRHLTHHKGRHHSRRMTKSSPMKKRALGCWTTTDSETIPLRQTAHSIRFAPASRSACSSNREQFGESADNISGGTCRGTGDASRAEPVCSAVLRPASATPGQSAGCSSGSGDATAPPSAPGAAPLSATSDDSAAAAAPSWCNADPREPTEVAAATSTLWVTLAAETHSVAAGPSKRGRLAGLLVARCRSDSEVGMNACAVSEGGISSPSDPSLDLCCGERVGADGGAEGLSSAGCSDVWLLNSQWSLAEHRHSFGSADWSAGPCTRYELDWGEGPVDTLGDSSLGVTVWANGGPSTDGSSWLAGPVGPDGGTASW